MKKALKKFNRTLSIMLAAAMALTMVPQTAMPVLAAENDAVIETQVETEAADATEIDESPVDPTADEEEEAMKGDDQESADADVDDRDANDADASGSDASAEDDSASAADIVVNGNEGNEGNDPAPTETFDITIDEFIAVKRQMKKIEVVIGEAEAVPVTNTKITVEKGKTVTLQLTPKAGFKIKTVMDGENKLEAAEAAGVYSYVIGAVTAAKTIKITTVTAYDIDLDNAKALGTSIKLDESLKYLASELTLGGTEGKTKSVVEKAANQDVKFTVAGFDADDETNADKKLHVYYVVDNSEDEMTEIQAIEGKYTVPANEISIVEESVKIVLEVETKSVVTFTENANVEVKVQGKDAEEKDVWVATDAVGTINSAFVGDEFKFKAEGKAPYAVSRVIVNGEEIDLAEDGVYTIILEKATTIAFETEIDSKQSVPLTFTIDGAENSATAWITSITPAATDGETTAITTFSGITEILGITSVDLEAGKAVWVPKTVTALTVTVAPANGYILSAEEGETAKTEYKFATTADAGNDVEAIGDAMNVNVKTEVEVLTGDSVFFKAAVKTNDPGLDDLKVITEKGKVEQAKKEDQDVEDVYEVKEGTATVKFTVKAKIGYILKDITENAMVQSVTEKEAEDGSIEYTVAIFAKQIKGADTDNATVFEAESAVRTFTAKIEPEISSEREFAEKGLKYIVTAEDGTEDIIWVSDPRFDDGVPYGASLKVTIEANYGHSLTVTYTMGGETVKVPVHDAWYGDRIDAADVFIDKVTADVTINVETSKNYSLSTLIDKDGNWLYGYDGAYEVRYDTAYLVGVKVGRTQIPAKDVTAVVKNAKGEVVSMSTPVVSADYPVADTTYRKINLANKPEFRGQDITVEMYVAGVEEKVGTYVLSVYNETTKIEIQDANGVKIDKVVQLVDSYEEYTIDTDGTLDEWPDITGASELIDDAWIAGDKLVIVTAAKSSDDIKDKTATITVNAVDNDDVAATVTVAAKALFDESKAPKVTKIVNAAADTVFHVDVEMDLGEDFQEPYNGSLWYEVKAEAKPGTDGKTLPEELRQSVTTHVERTGKGQRVKLEVGRSNLLGAGAEWDYEVTAQLIYMNNDWFDDYSDYSDDDIVVKSAVSEKEECGTVEPLFTTALKLKKGSDKVALYTGRETESVIATIQWDNKKDNDKKFYKVADENIRDDKKGLDFAVRGDQIIVTDIDVNAELGKHTITVLATADQTPNHEMYASRATIAVTVVKGINNIIVTTPGTSIYKPAGASKAAALKLGVDYNHDYVGEPDDYEAQYASWDGKKYVTSPKAKKVTWEIVSEDWSDADCASPSPIPKNIADYVKVKNGTITVDKKFQVDENHASNNRFKVKVTAADYAGNETYGLSDVIEISSNAVDISKLIIVNGSYQSGYEVKAVHDITDKNAVSISASDVEGGYVFAMPASAIVKVGDKFASRSEVMNNLPIVETSIVYASGNKKVLTVDEDGYIEVLAAGKKAAVKVSTADGSNNKKTHTMNLTLDYKATAGSDLALGIQVRTADNSYSGSSSVVFDPNTEGNVAKANTANVKETPVTTDFNATGAARLYVQLYVGDKANAASTSYSRPADVWSTNYKLAVKGGKFVMNANGIATIITTAKETTLTLTDQSPEAKKVKKAAYVYKLTNTAYDTTKVAKAPKVTVKNTLHQWGISEEQKVELTVLDATKKPYAEGKSAKIEMDWSARTDKNEWNLNQFAGNIKSNIVALSADGSIKLEFTGASDLTPGSYKLKVTVGTAQDGSFTAETLPATVTVKVIKAKVATFKLNTTYKISKLDGGAVLTGKSNLNAKEGEKMTTSFSGLKNANVNGKSNNFTKYFEIKHDPDGTCRLAMTEYLKAELENGNKEMTDLDKKDLTGYITYHAQPNVSYYNTSKLVETEVKITVKPVKSTK